MWVLLLEREGTSVSHRLTYSRSHGFSKAGSEVKLGSGGFQSIFEGSFLSII
jgi:hypothetical protein